MTRPLQVITYETKWKNFAIKLLWRINGLKLQGGTTIAGSIGF